MTLVSIDRMRLSTLRRMVAQVEKAVDWYHLLAGMASRAASFFNGIAARCLNMLLGQFWLHTSLSNNWSALINSQLFR